jgi:hypothetical protein
VAKHDSMGEESRKTFVLDEFADQSNKTMRKLKINGKS